MSDYECRNRPRSMSRNEKAGACSTVFKPMQLDNFTHIGPKVELTETFPPADYLNIFLAFASIIHIAL